MKLILFSGLPGTGKSVLSEEIAQILQIPVFSLDWVLGAMLLSEFRVQKQGFYITTAEALLTMLTQRQFMLGQSVILDIPANTIAERKRWQNLAQSHSAAFYGIETICSERSLHRQRVESRRRKIPGWHDTVHWSHVEQMRLVREAWTADEGEYLTIDAVHLKDKNVQTILKYVEEST
ncbi:AAA family ATPase [Chroococcus sp. FPU101]|uniref:AAA family ATPase n=1 Tax=Chroococcus sp. FPU101 TaxID=1974212 RepID=UPI001A8F7971|nr:AAA family ATPase [Chroococcus sp. FPU101]